MRVGVAQSLAQGYGIPFKLCCSHSSCRVVILQAQKLPATYLVSFWVCCILCFIYEKKNPEERTLLEFSQERQHADLVVGFWTFGWGFCRLLKIDCAMSSAIHVNYGKFDHVWRSSGARAPFLRSIPEPNKFKRRLLKCLMDNGSPSVTAAAAGSISCSTFNILAPIYKRINKEGVRESEFREKWFSRNESIIDVVLSRRSSIFCLQEFWIENEEFVKIYEKRFHEAGYEILRLQRTNNRGDGLLTAIRNDQFRVLNHRELCFNDFGDRVAQLLHLESVTSFGQNETGGASFELIVVNTHLLFPHNSNYSLVRLRQVYRILEYLYDYKAEHNLASVPVLLCGDWNGSKKGQVYKFLRSQGFISSYDTAHNYSDNEVDAHKWVSHQNHRGNICGVDFIWLLNPGQSRKHLRDSWMEAVSGLIKLELKKVGLDGSDAFDFFKPENKPDDYQRRGEFWKGLQQLVPLTDNENQEFTFVADLNGNGVINNNEFQKMLIAQLSEKKYSVPERMSESQKGTASSSNRKSSPNFNYNKPKIVLEVTEAYMFPSEVERGIWPEDYYLSDHALLTVTFSQRKGCAIEKMEGNKIGMASP